MSEFRAAVLALGFIREVADGGLHVCGFVPQGVEGLGQCRGVGNGVDCGSKLLLGRLDGIHPFFGRVTGCIKEIVIGFLDLIPGRLDLLHRGTWLERVLEIRQRCGERIGGSANR